MSGAPMSSSPTTIMDASHAKSYYYTTVAGAKVVEYIAIASPGTAKTAAGWQITKFTYDTDGNVTDQTWAGGTDAFDKICNSYATYSYS
jgi:YD repeat-containing protein